MPNGLLRNIGNTGTRKSDLARPYKIMAASALAKVRHLKRHIREIEAIQKRIDELALRIAEIDAKHGAAAKDR
jgi:hypothetical protein